MAACAAAIGVLVGVSTAAAQTISTERPPIDELMRALQAKYELVADYSADFEHTYAGGLLRTTVTERGTVLIKKPYRMRWQYETDDEKLYVSDGDTFYSYFPNDRQVIVTPLPDASATPISALFLAGEGNLQADFHAAYDETATRDANWTLRLTPRDPARGSGDLVVMADRASLSIVGITTVDAQGGHSTYRFTRVVENQGLSDSLFDFRIPADTEVIRDDRTGP